MPIAILIVGFMFVVYLGGQISEFGKEWGPIAGYILGVIAASLAKDSERRAR